MSTNYLENNGFVPFEDTMLMNLFNEFSMDLINSIWVAASVPSLGLGVFREASTHTRSLEGSVTTVCNFTPFAILGLVKHALRARSSLVSAPRIR